METNQSSKDVKASESNSAGSMEQPKETKPRKENKEATQIAALKKQGFYNCTRFKLKKGANHNIVDFGEEVNRIKAMHESNIDTYNEQQLNTLMFIKKDGVDYELTKVFAKGRELSTGEPNPYRVFVEKKK